MHLLLSTCFCQPVSRVWVCWYSSPRHMCWVEVPDLNLADGIPTVFPQEAKRCFCYLLCAKLCMFMCRLMLESLLMRSLRMFKAFSPCCMKRWETSLLLIRGIWRKCLCVRVHFCFLYICFCYVQSDLRVHNGSNQSTSLLMLTLVKGDKCFGGENSDYLFIQFWSVLEWSDLSVAVICYNLLLIHLHAKSTLFVVWQPT